MLFLVTKVWQIFLISILSVIAVAIIVCCVVFYNVDRDKSKSDTSLIPFSNADFIHSFSYGDSISIKLDDEVNLRANNNDQNYVFYFDKALLSGKNIVNSLQQNVEFALSQ